MAEFVFRASDITDADALGTLLLRAAAQHGADSDPDHEAGDLQDALRDAIAIMTPEQRIALYNKCVDRITDGFVDFDEFDPDDPKAEITLDFTGTGT